jgi:hypothetical protein
LNLFFDNKYSYEIAADVASLEHFFDKKCEEEIKRDSLLGETLTYKLSKAYKVYELEYIQTSIRIRTLLDIHLLFELKSVDEQTIKVECVTKNSDVSKLFIVAFFVILFFGSVIYFFNYQIAIDFKVVSIFTLKIIAAFIASVSYIFLQIKWDLYAHKEILKKLIKEFETENAN